MTKQWTMFSNELHDHVTHFYSDSHLRLQIYFRFSHCSFTLTSWNTIQRHVPSG